MTTATMPVARPGPEPAHPPEPPRRRGRLRTSVAKHWYAWAMVVPVTVVLGVLVGYPLVRGVYLSLTNANEANVGRTIGVNHIPASYEFVGLDNYLDLLSGAEGSFYPRLGWTLVWTASCVLLHYVIGLGLAMLLNRPLRGRSVYRVLLILPWAVPAFVSAFAWRLLFNSQFGVFNVALTAVGLPAVEWLNQPVTAQLSVIAVNVWLGVPFMMVALLGGLQAIPAALYEAAEVDGATPWQRFRHITLPGLQSVSGTVILLGTIWTFNMFPIIFLLTGGGPGDATQILVTYAYQRAFQGIRDYSGAATYGVLILSLLLIFSVFYRRTLRKQGEVW
jgi:arabinogalactan oligomer/maltooligosaccharide transport system permease protein